MSTSSPCFGCLKEAVQAGIDRVVYDTWYPVDYADDLADQYQRLYEHLVRSLAGEVVIEVILDRRVERRRGGGSAPGREGQVERRLLPRVDEGLRTFGWAFVKIDRP